MKTKTQVAHAKRVLGVGLAIVLVAAVFVSLLQTNFGSVSIKQLEIVTDEGNKIAAMMYLPKGVSKDNPAPGVLAVHGGNSSRYAVSNFAQEFSRRGYVVISIDQSNNGQSDRGENAFFGTEAAMKYMTTLAFVDQTRLGVIGHSMGNTVVSMAAANPQFNVKAGVTLGAAARLPSDAPINVCILIGTKDENTGPRGNDTAVRGPIDAAKSMSLAATFGLPAGEHVVLGHEYGSRADNTLRVMQQPKCGHLGILYSREAIGMALDFMGDVLGVDYTIDPSSQTWFFRELASAVAYIGLFVVAFGVLGMLLGRKKELTAESASEGHATVNAGYWIGLALMCIIPAFAIQSLYMTGKAFFTAVSQNVFAMEHINGVIFWMICSAIGILAANLVIKKVTKEYDWGFDRKVLKTDSRELLGYVQIAVLTTLALYAVVYLVGFFFDVNIRFINTEVHLFTRTRFFVFWAYLPLYLLYYVIIGYVQTTGLLHKGQPAWSQYLRTALVSLVGPGVMLIAWYGSVGLTGINYLFEWRFVLGVLTNFLPGLVIGALIQVYSYRRTGKIWLGAIINSVLFTWMSTSIGVMLPPV